MFLSKTTFSVSCSLWVGGVQFSRKMNDKDIPPKNLQNLRRAFLQSPCGKVLVMGSIFDKVAGIGSGPAT